MKISRDVARAVDPQASRVCRTWSRGSEHCQPTSFTNIKSVHNSRRPLSLNFLYTPLEPLIDLIFGHGLRGGSFKTWRKNDEPRYFWPRAWLPFDPDLENMRVHTFGYNSGWTELKDSILNVHDFGRSLLGEMVASPELRKDGNVRSLYCHTANVRLIAADANYSCSSNWYFLRVFP